MWSRVKLSMRRMQRRETGGSSQGLGLPSWLSGKEPAGDARDLGLIPGSGRSLGGEMKRFNPMNRGAWQATVHGVEESWARLSNWAHTHTHTHTLLQKRISKLTL